MCSNCGDPDRPNHDERYAAMGRQYGLDVDTVAKLCEAGGCYGYEFVRFVVDAGMRPCNSDVINMATWQQPARPFEEFEPITDVQRVLRVRPYMHGLRRPWWQR